MDFVIVLTNFSFVLIIVAVNAFFVAAEFAIVKVRSTQLDSLAKTGDVRARLAHHIVSHLDQYLSASQLGITMTSLALGWVGEPAVAHLLEPPLTWLGITNPAAVSTIAFTVGFSIITVLHIILGEQAPKWLAIQRAEATTLFIARPLHLFFVIFRPFIVALNHGANFFVRMLGIQPIADHELAHSEEELRLMLSHGKNISTTSRSILLRAMELRERTVREVMVPRTQIAFLSTEKTVEENMTTALDNQFTRYPLCEKNLDSVLGMIHMKDLFKLKQQHGQGSRLLEIKRDLLFVPESTPLEKILNTFLAKRILMAIAVDEYGGTAGLITLENVLEELVGEIRDEFDVEPLMVQKVSESEFVVDGAMPLHDFARMFDVVPDTKDVVTVSGYAIQLLGHVPAKGETLSIGKWAGAIDAVEARKVKALRIRKSEASGEKAQ